MDLLIRDMHPDEAETAAALVLDCFKRFVGSTYSQQGVDTFKQYAAPAAMRLRLANHESYILIALEDHLPVGLIEVRQANHIALLFVDAAHQRRGIARRLFSEALQRSRVLKPGLTFMEVNSSPYALEVYRRLGFAAEGAESERDGIRFIPMIMKL